MRDRECLLCRVDGRYELHIQLHGRMTHLQTFPDEHAARHKAGEWRKAAETFPVS
jgi:hypothetical protein